MIIHARSVSHHQHIRLMVLSTAREQRRIPLEVELVHYARRPSVEASNVDHQINKV